MRRSDDSWLGGVCSGLAERLGIDPLVIRALFVVLSLGMGLGVLLYLVAWLLIPDRADNVHLESALRHGEMSSVFILAATVLSLFGGFGWFGDWDGNGRWGGGGSVLWGLLTIAVVVGGGWWLWTEWRGRTDPGYYGRFTGSSGGTGSSGSTGSTGATGPSGGSGSTGGTSGATAWTPGTAATRATTHHSQVPPNSLLGEDRTPGWAPQGTEQTLAGGEREAQHLGWEHETQRTNTDWEHGTQRTSTGWEHGLGQQQSGWEHGLGQRQSGWEHGASRPQSPRPPRAPRPPKPPRRPGRRSAGAAGTLLGTGLALAAGGSLYWAALEYGWSADPLVLGLAGVLGALGLVILVLGLSGRTSGFPGFLAVMALLTTALVLPMSVNFVPSGRVGDFAWTPQSESELVAAAPYRVGAGTARLDLSDLSAADLNGETIEASVSVGQLVIVIPEDLTVRIDAGTALGAITHEGTLDPATIGGVNVTSDLLVGDGPVDLIIDAHAGIGQISLKGQDR